MPKNRLTATLLYSDEHIAVFDKPTGMLVIPDRYDPTLPVLLLDVRDQYGPEASNAHRIDKDTTGLVVFGLTADACKSLGKQFEERTTCKTYTAVVRGIPRTMEGTIDAPLAPDRQIPGLMRVNKKGKQATTNWKVLEGFRSGWSLLELQPQTGRTHQIRVHLANIGCPIACDPLYGNAAPLMLSSIRKGYKRKKNEPERPLIARTALHAGSIAFDHPATGERVEFTAPLPHDMEVALNMLRKWGS
mgnify:CR=1 FL=1